MPDNVEQDSADLCCDMRVTGVVQDSGFGAVSLGHHPPSSHIIGFAVKHLSQHADRPEVFMQKSADKLLLNTQHSSAAQVTNAQKHPPPF